MFTFLVIIVFSVFFQRIGFRSLLKSKIFGKQGHDFFAYFYLMTSGVLLGEYVSLDIFPYFFSFSVVELIGIGTVLSILSGEIVYYHNYRLMNRIITTSNKE